MGRCCPDGAQAQAESHGKYRNEAGFGKKTYRLCIEAISFISCSTAAIFSADVGCCLPIPKNDILTVCITKINSTRGVRCRPQW